MPVAAVPAPVGTPLEARGAELPLEELERRHNLENGGESSSSVTLCHCQGCGAQMEITQSANLASCPFCDRKVTTSRSRSTTSLQEPIVVPFGIDEATAVGRMAEHVSKLWLRPGSVRKLILSGRHVRKVYLPFWAFDVQAATDWDARVRRWKNPGLWGRLTGAEGRYETQLFSGRRARRWDDWLVCASHGLDPELVEDLEPFSIGRASLLPQSAAPGDIPLERGTLGPASAWEKAKVGLRRREYRLSMQSALKQAGESDDEGVSIDGKVEFGEPLGKAVVLPLYILCSRTLYGQVQVVVNGETGQVASRVPYSWLKAGPVGAAGTAAVGLACVVTMGGFAPVLAGCVAWGWYSRKKQRERDENTFMAR